MNAWQAELAMRHCIPFTLLEICVYNLMASASTLYI
jgi:hypothetical protein